jgi:pimeloyl-ACP methyl ester carboxylesterase
MTPGDYQLGVATVDGAAVRYRVSGDGEPLVLLHGLGGSWRWWSPLFETLAQNHRVYAVDLPRNSFGDGELSSWVIRLLDALGLDCVDIAGHSLGGYVAADVAAENDERVRRLVLVAPAGVPCGRAMPTIALYLPDALQRIRSRLPMVVVDGVRTGATTLVRGGLFATQCDLRDKLPAVQAPTLLIWGEHDRLIPLRLADEWQRVLPRAELARLRCGHVPMLEAPDDVASLMLTFLDQPTDDRGDKRRTRVVNDVRRRRHDDQAA